MVHLVKHAQEGDAEAFIQLIEANQDMLKRIAAAWLKNENDIADAIQDTILDAFEHLDQLKKEEYFKTWLVRILINNCTKIYRKTKKYTKFEISTDVYSFECQANGNSMDPAYTQIEFLDLLRALPKDSRVIFQMFFGEQFTTAEIAEILHMKENTVRSKIHRGKIQLRKQAEKWQ